VYSELFHNGPSDAKSKTITNRENLMIVLLSHFQIIVDVIEYYASARTFAMNGTECFGLCGPICTRHAMIIISKSC